MKSLIIAREKEQAMLSRLMQEPTAQFLPIYGRGRIGKTFLIREYFDDKFAFKHTAVSPLEFKDKDEKLLYRIQLDEFAWSLKKYGAKLEGPIRNWFDAFHELEDLLDHNKSKFQIKKWAVSLTTKNGIFCNYESLPYLCKRW